MKAVLNTLNAIKPAGGAASVTPPASIASTPGGGESESACHTPECVSAHALAGHAARSAGEPYHHRRPPSTCQVITDPAAETRPLADWQAQARAPMPPTF